MVTGIHSRWPMGPTAHFGYITIVRAITFMATGVLRWKIGLPTGPGFHFHSSEALPSLGRAGAADLNTDSAATMASEEVANSLEGIDSEADFVEWFHLEVVAFPASTTEFQELPGSDHTLPKMVAAAVAG